MGANKSLLNNAGWSALSHLLERGSLVIASIILANMLPTADFAAYSYFQLTVSMFAAYASMGLGVTAAKYFSEVSDVASHSPSSSLLGTVWLLTIILGGCISIVILFIPYSWLNTTLNIPIWFFSLGIFSLSLSVIPNAGIIGLEKFRLAVFSSFVASLIIICGSITAGIVGSASVGMFVFVISSIIRSGINILIIFKFVSYKKIVSSVDFKRASLLSIFKFAGPLLVVTLLSSSVTWMLGRILLITDDGEYQFTLYAIGLQWLALTLFLPGMITRVIFPKFVKSKLNAGGDNHKQTKSLMRDGVLYAGLSSLLVCITVILLDPVLIGLYGEKFSNHRWLIVWFALAALPMAPSGSIGNGIVANDKQIVWLFFTTVWFFCLLILAWFMRIYGAVGMAVSYGACSLIMLFMGYSYARKKGFV